MTSAGTISNPVGFYLSVLREERGMNAKEAAKEIGIRNSTYWYYEIGRNAPGLPNAIKIARFYGLSVEELAEKCGWSD